MKLHTRIAATVMLTLCLHAQEARAQDPLLLIGSNFVGAQSHGISFDGTEWHIANFSGGQRIYDQTFAFLRSQPSPGGEIRGLAYHAARGTVFMGAYSTGPIYEVSLAGMTLGSFPIASSSLNALAVNDNDGSLWLVGYLGDVVNVTAAGAVISSFTTPGLNWTGAAYDEVRDHLLLLETDDDLYEYTPTGVSVGNPIVGDAVPNNGQGLDYDSTAGVLHITSQDGDIAIYSRSGGPPAPTCSLTGPIGVVTGDAPLDLDSAAASAMSVDVVFEYSLDGGASWLPCTASIASALPNPAAGVPVGIAAFTWDTVSDGVGALAPAVGVLARATVDDGVSLATGMCLTAAFDVDNAALCQGICGDCDLSAVGPNILDALAAAQFAAGLGVPSMAQQGCCDVDSGLSITVLDALTIAQTAAGLPVPLVCP